MVMGLVIYLHGCNNAAAKRTVFWCLAKINWENEGGGRDFRGKVWIGSN